MKLNTELAQFVNNLKPKQIENWRKLIQFMRDNNDDYNHNDFSSEYCAGYCALSWAIGAGIVEGDSYYFINYNVSTDEAFGEGAYKNIFDSQDGVEDYGLTDDDEHNFAEFCYHHGIRDLGNTASSIIADAFETLINFKDFGDIVKITIHWKSNQKDNFASIKSLKEYLELNPHRKNGYRKITATKKVQRIVYDEVTETIEL